MLIIWKFLFTVCLFVYQTCALEITEDRIDRGAFDINLGDIRVHSGASWSFVDRAISAFVGELHVEHDAGFYITLTNQWLGLDVGMTSLHKSIVNHGIIAFNSVVSLVRSSYDLIGYSFTNTGEMYFGSSGAIPGKLGLTAEYWTNEGLLVFYQNQRTSSSVKLGRSLGSITNDGQICFFHQVFHQITDIVGNGCLTAQKDSTIYIPSAAQSFDTKQSIYLADNKSSIVVQALSTPQTFNVFGFGAGNKIGLTVPLLGIPLVAPAFSYSPETGVLTLRATALSQRFNIGTGYDPNLFKLVTDWGEGLPSTILGSVQYNGPVPNLYLPVNCRAECKSLPEAPGIEPIRYVTTLVMQGRDSLETVSCVVDIGTDTQGSWYTTTSFFPRNAKEPEASLTTTATTTDSVVSEYSPLTDATISDSADVDSESGDADSGDNGSGMLLSSVTISIAEPDETEINNTSIQIDDESSLQSNHDLEDIDWNESSSQTSYHNDAENIATPTSEPYLQSGMNERDGVTDLISLVLATESHFGGCESCSSAIVDSSSAPVGNGSSIVPIESYLSPYPSESQLSAAVQSSDSNEFQQLVSESESSVRQIATVSTDISPQVSNQGFIILPDALFGAFPIVPDLPNRYTNTWEVTDSEGLVSSKSGIDSQFETHKNTFTTFPSSGYNTQYTKTWEVTNNDRPISSRSGIVNEIDATTSTITTFSPLLKTQYTTTLKATKSDESIWSESGIVSQLGNHDSTITTFPPNYQTVSGEQQNVAKSDSSSSRQSDYSVNQSDSLLSQFGSSMSEFDFQNKYSTMKEITESYGTLSSRSGAAHQSGVDTTNNTALTSEKTTEYNTTWHFTNLDGFISSLSGVASQSGDFIATVTTFPPTIETQVKSSLLETEIDSLSSSKPTFVSESEISDLKINDLSLDDQVDYTTTWQVTNSDGVEFNQSGIVRQSSTYETTITTFPPEHQTQYTKTWDAIDLQGSVINESGVVSESGNFTTTITTFPRPQSDENFSHTEFTTTFVTTDSYGNNITSTKVLIIDTDVNSSQYNTKKSHLTACEAQNCVETEDIKSTDSIEQLCETTPDCTTESSDPCCSMFVPTTLQMFSVNGPITSTEPKVSTIDNIANILKTTFIEWVLAIAILIM